MRIPRSPAVAPADRRLFEAGSLLFGAVGLVSWLVGAGLEVGRHIEEQF